MKKMKSLLAFVLVSLSAVVMAEEIVVKDGDVELAQDELASMVARWTPQMKQSAILDEGDRLELINLMLANKKVALEAEKMAAGNETLYWEYKAGLRSYQRNFVLQKYRDTIEIPDFSELAREQYEVKKDKLALNPERRMSSHILFSSPPGLDRTELTAEAQKVLDELRAGADFQAMVVEHSDEPNAAAKGGKFNRWVAFGEKGVSPRYSEGLFTIEKVGEYSEIVNSEFGLHIIRLDGIQEKSYKPFAEVKAGIVKNLEDEYAKLAMKHYLSQFNMSEDAVIDDEAVNAILAPYKTGE